tara:strand:- start:326 stop:526 length:201 start_codon:yes stop_codon:yes gene_type:complete
MVKYTEKQIKEAVDIAIGDDGFRGKEVIEILKVMNKEKEINMITKSKNNKKKTQNMISCIGYRGEK